MSQDHLADLSVEELQSYLSDFHKDFYGFRPRGVYTPAEWQDRTVLSRAINQIHDAMDRMKATPEGRKELRSAGWVIDEPEDIIDPEEYANWSADLDAVYYGDLA